jgi:3-methyladenine DNA glycosylase AlkC
MSTAATAKSESISSPSTKIGGLSDGFMPSTKTEERKMGLERTEVLEDMIDESSVAEILRDIEQVCYNKQEHILSNWQDDHLAERWFKIAQELQNASDAIDQI